MNGIQEVVGSIPIISTIVIFKESVFAEFFSGTGFLLSIGARHRSALLSPAEYTRASPLPGGCRTGFFASEAVKV